ncbi:hypothetical protein BH10ACT3_BH10ACT3_16590 [soil metagenome]
MQDDDPTEGAQAGPTADAAVADEAAEIERLLAENEALRAEVDGTTQDRAVVKTRRRRGVLSIALVVIGALLLPLAVGTVWMRNQVLDTDRYLATVAPLGDDPAVVSALSTRISDAVIAEIDVKALAKDALPDNAQFLAAPIAAGASTLVQTATTKLLESDQFDELWINANRTAHQGLVNVLTGRTGPVINSEDGKVVLSLGPLIERVLKALDDQFGINISSRVPADKIDIKFTLIDSPQLAKIQNQVRWFDRLSYFTLILSALCFIGAILAATERRKGFLRVGVGVVVAMVLMKLSLSTGRDVYLSHLPSAVHSPKAAAAVFDTLTRFLLQAVRVLFVVGAVILVAAWVAGPSRAATWVRTLWNRLLGRGASGLGGTVDLGPVPTFFAAHLGAIRVAIAALAAIILITWDRPTGKVVLLIAVVALVLVAITQVLAGATRPSDDDADTAEVDPDASAEPEPADA